MLNLAALLRMERTSWLRTRPEANFKARDTRACLYRPVAIMTRSGDGALSGQRHSSLNVRPMAMQCRTRRLER
jgi:hypothetical protein